MALTEEIAGHSTTLVTIIGGLLVITQSLVAVIFLGIKGDLREIKTAMQVFTKEIFERLRTVELSIEKLWAEHRITKGTDCGEHHHRKEDPAK